MVRVTVQQACPGFKVAVSLYAVSVVEDEAGRLREHVYTHTVNKTVSFSNQRGNTLPGAIYQPQETGRVPEGLG